MMKGDYPYTITVTDSHSSDPILIGKMLCVRSFAPYEFKVSKSIDII